MERDLAEANAYEDPLQEQDPWGNGGRQPADEWARSSGRGRQTTSGTFTQVGLTPQEPPAQRIIHDVPPTWDGHDPDNQAEPYLKLLSGWINTTRTLKTQRGMTILHYAAGDLKLIINELDVDTLTSEQGGQSVYDHVKDAYSEYLDKKLPKAMERALFAPEARRRRDETMVQYVSRKRTLPNDLDRTKCVLPSSAKGYVLLRDAQLSDRAWDTI